jgi:hypothetical protein
MKLGKYSIPEVRKFLVAASGILVILLNSALDEFAAYLPDPVPGVITTVVGIATAVGVFLTKNAPVIDAAADRLG